MKKKGWLIAGKEAAWVQLLKWFVRRLNLRDGAMLFCQTWSETLQKERILKSLLSLCLVILAVVVILLPWLWWQQTRLLTVKGMNKCRLHAVSRGPTKGLLKDTGSKSTWESMGRRGEGDGSIRVRGDVEEGTWMRIKEKRPQWVEEEKIKSSLSIHVVLLKEREELYLSPSTHKTLVHLVVIKLIYNSLINRLILIKSFFSEG